MLMILKKLFIVSGVDMSCLKPIYALDLGVINPDTGNRKIKILPKRADTYNRLYLENKYGKGNVLALPCGKCINCLQDYSRQWALRCVAEASLYDINYFLTLTYSPEKYPGKLVKSDFQDFVKALRNRGFKFRYFGCGEHGTKSTERAHYHLILFGLNIPDIKCIGKGPKGGYYYSSKIITDCWNKGFIVLGDCNYTTCNYVARYVLKKVDNHHDDDFVLMSNRPGIGKEYFLKHIDAAKQSDKLYISNSGRYYSSLPRYFDKILKELDPKKADELKLERINRANLLVNDQLIKFNKEYVEDLNLNILQPAAFDKLKNQLNGRSSKL